MKHFSLTTFVFLASITLFTIPSLNGMDLSNDDATFFLEEDDFDAVNELRATPCLTTEEIVDALTNPLNGIQLQNILQTDLYKHTNPILVRPLLDMPTLQPLTVRTKNWSFTVQAFFNQMRNVFFTRHSDKIASYLNITAESDFLNKIDEIEFITADVPDLVNPFGTKIHLEQRRAGLMFNTCKQTQDWIFTAALPLYYLENNFFMTADEQQDVESQDLKDILRTNNVRDFMKRHLVSDRFGIGDLRINVHYKGIKKNNDTYQVGGQITFPSAGSFKKGIVGGVFNPHACIPFFNLETFFNLACQSKTSGPEQLAAQFELQDYLFDFGVGTLDRLTTVVADNTLGQKHVSVGPTAELKHTINQHADLLLYLEVDYFFPAIETRFFKQVKTPQEFDRDYTDSQLALQNLNFLNQQVINTLYPTPVDVRIQPGAVVKATSTLTGNWRSWYTALGFDYWMQSEEKIGCLPSEFNLCAGRKPWGYQGKIFARINAERHIEPWSWGVALHGDATIFNSGIGNDWLIGFDFNCYF